MVYFNKKAYQGWEQEFFLALAASSPNYFNTVLLKAVVTLVAKA